MSLKKRLFLIGDIIVLPENYDKNINLFHRVSLHLLFNRAHFFLYFFTFVKKILVLDIGVSL